LRLRAMRKTHFAHGIGMTEWKSVHREGWWRVCYENEYTLAHCTPVEERGGYGLGPVPVAPVHLLALSRAVAGPVTSTRFAPQQSTTTLPIHSPALGAGQLAVVLSSGKRNLESAALNGSTSPKKSQTAPALKSPRPQHQVRSVHAMCAHAFTRIQSSPRVACAP
jgi:hypothetical protein